MARRARRIVLYLAGIYIVWCAFLYSMQDALMFPTSMFGPAPAEPPASWAESLEVLTTEIGGGESALAWLLPARAATAARPRPLVAFFHGNAERIDHQQWIVDAYHALGVSVLLVEYRGYGHSGGKPSQKGIVADAIALLDLALDRADVDADRVVLHGRSVGAAVAAQVAAARKPALLILRSPFTHAGAFAWRHGVPPLLVKNPFRTREILPTLGAPVAIFHGSRDNVIPLSHGEALHAITPGSTLVTYACGHNDFPGPGNERAFWGEVARLLQDTGVLRP